MATKRDMVFGKLTVEESKQLQKVMPYNLIKEVTLAMNDINFAGFESRVKEMIITLLE